MITNHPDNADTRIRQLRQFPEKTDETPRDDISVFIPIIQNIAEEENNLGITTRLLQETDDAPLRIAGSLIMRGS